MLKSPVAALNKSHKGKASEARWSAIIHNQATPILIDPHFLRRRGLGQIDIAVCSKQNIYLYEVKTSARFALSPSQRRRLRASADYLSQLFKRPVICRYLAAQLSIAF